MKTIPCIHAANGFAMSHQPQIIDNSFDGSCETCGETMRASDVSVEAFEISGKIVCPECADEIFEDNSQFGVGA